MQAACYYCGRFGEVTRDHVNPRSRGGGGPDNIVPACARCNNKKGDLPPREWFAWLKSPEGIEFLAGSETTKPLKSLFGNTPGMRSGHCTACGGKEPRHFTRCTALWAKQTAAFNGSS